VNGGTMNVSDDKNIPEVAGENNAEEQKTEETPVSPEPEEKPAEEAPKEESASPVKAAEANPAEEKPEEEAPKEEKLPGFQPKSTTPQRPVECSACGKAFTKKIWYYRDAAFYCNKKCYRKKSEEDKKKAEEDRKKAEEAAASTKEK